MRELAYIEQRVTFKTRSIIQRDVYDWCTKKPENENRSLNLLQASGNYAYNGYLSPATARMVKKKLEVWLTAIELSTNLRGGKKEVNAQAIYPTFVTLTLPSAQVHDDNEIKRNCLDPFIKWLTTETEEVYKRGPKKGQKKGFGVKNYFWRAEPQKNGNIHFHIICDKYIPWEGVRDRWNLIIDRLGYVTRYAESRKELYKDGFVADQKAAREKVKELKEIFDKTIAENKMPENAHPILVPFLEIALETGVGMPEQSLQNLAVKLQEQRYEKELACGFRNPNSTDIHNIINLDSIGAYVTKYVTKMPKEKPLPPGKKLVEEDGKNYVYDVIENPNKHEGFEDALVNRTEYVPQFFERKITGRVWGCSDTLRDQDDYKIDYFSVNRSEQLLYVADNLINGKTESKVMVTDRDVNDDECERFINYVMRVDKDGIARLSEKMPENFKSMGGVIMPMTPENLGFERKRKNGKPNFVTVEKVLQKHSPVLHYKYVTHYKGLFVKMYS